MGVHAVLKAFGWGQEASSGGTVTGPAPLAVFFDATESYHDTDNIDTFHHCGYHFDFGYATPSTPGTWTHSGQSKGNQVGGPIAAHVFETAGTYQVSVKVQDALGNSHSTSLTVTVLDPDTYWTTGGRSTVTISTTTGAWSAWASNTRYLLNAGSDYTARGAIQINNLQNVFIGRTGAGADPLVDDCDVDRLESASTPTTGARVVFDRLNSNGSLSCRVGGTDMLWYKCTAADATGGAAARGRYNAYSAQTWVRPTRACYCECTIDENSVDYPYFTEMWQFMWLGNTSIRPQFHNLRVQGAQYAFVGHNRHYNLPSGSGALTFRAVGVGDVGQTFNESVEPASRYIVAADNYLLDTGDPGSSQYVGPQNATSVESLEHVIIERTRFADTGLSPSQWTLVRGCKNITIRDETYDNLESTGVRASLDYGEGYVPDAWQNGPWWSTDWKDTVDGTYRKTAPASILPTKAGTEFVTQDIYISEEESVLVETAKTTVQDGYSAYFLANGASAGSTVQDMERQFLIARGIAASGKTNADMWTEFLVGLGYSGTLNEARRVWWADSAPLS